MVSEKHLKNIQDNNSMCDKIILFGGSGFLGDVFLRENPGIISVGRTRPSADIKNRHIYIQNLDDLSALDGIEFDKVIFLIGNSNHHMLNNSCMSGIEHNVIPLKKVLHYMKNRSLKKFVCFTSILLYGTEPNDGPVDENQQIFPYENEYIFSKYLAEQVVEFYSKQVPIINVRLSNIYGATTLIRPDLIPTLIHNALTDMQPTVWSIKPERDFIFTSDAAEAILMLLNTDYTGDINLGSGVSSSVGEIVKIVEELSGKIIGVLDRRVSGVMKFVTDISLVKRLTGWKPNHTLRQGIEKTFEIMKNNLK